MPAARITPDLEMHYEIDDYTDPWTQPETVLLLHGNAESAAMWFGWVPTLARHFRVVRTDMRGFASSTPMPRDYEWTLDRVIDVLGKGAGASWYFVHRAPFMARGEYPAGFRVRLHDKDLRICRDMAARHGATLPVVEATLADYARLLADGHGEEDISTIFRLKTPLFRRPARDG